MPECIFCGIIQGKLATQFIHTDNNVVAFEDIQPKAPVHILLVTRQHIATLNDLTENEHNLVAALTQTAVQLAKELGHAQKGYRLVMNCNEQGDQTIFHLHMHLLAGRKLNQGMG